MRTKILKNIVFLSLNKEIIHSEKVCDLCKPIKEYWETTLFKIVGNASWVLFLVYDEDKDVYIIRAYKYTTARGLWGREFSADTCGRADMDKALEPYNLRTILMKNRLYLTKK